ncbi:hypothetical protein [Serratia ficaria]|uniref:hypothetical protein n=1 Tax=Serratia ficaria TaxID=61651 RepID=UPI0021BD20AF|nr:hypothetical protein [Serratia ficaria]
MVILYGSPLFEGYEHVDGCFTCVGRAFGLWRLTQRLDDLLNYNVSYISGNEFTPCLPSIDNPVKQLMEYKLLDKPEDEMTEDELRDANRGMRITGNDLWITAVDVRKLIESQGDYHLLDTAYQHNLIMPKNLNDAPHHSAERHATNREQVLMAAFRFKDENEKLFESECRKDDGNYNFSAWARLVLERPFLFPDAEIKIKTEDSVSTIIGNAFKPPSQRRK